MVPKLSAKGRRQNRFFRHKLGKNRDRASINSSNERAEKVTQDEAEKCVSCAPESPDYFIDPLGTCEK